MQSWNYSNCCREVHGTYYKGFKKNNLTNQWDQGKFVFVFLGGEVFS